MNTALFSYYIIPLFTLHLARDTKYLYSNFSTICSALERHLEFFIWCAVTGIYFFLSIRRLYRSFASDPRFSPAAEDQAIAGSSGSPAKNKKENRLPAVSAGLLFCSALLPYLPEKLPFLSALHLLTAFSSSVLFFYCLFSLSFRLYFASPSLGRPALLLLIAAVSFCLAAWVYSGIINTAMEICLVFTACLLIRRFSLLFAKAHRPPG